jgi:flagellar basal-body rod protein FlgB
MSPTSNSLDQTGRQMGNFLSYLTQRQQVIASNIANADTPGYKTQDVTMPADFSAALTEAGNTVTEAPGLQTRNDGNNVSIDREARLLAETTMKFSLATQLVKTQLKNIRSAIEEGRTS